MSPTCSPCSKILFICFCSWFYLLLGLAYCFFVCLRSDFVWKYESVVDSCASLFVAVSGMKQNVSRAVSDSVCEDVHVISRLSVLCSTNGAHLYINGSGCVFTSINQLNLWCLISVFMLFCALSLSLYAHVLSSFFFWSVNVCVSICIFVWTVRVCFFFICVRIHACTCAWPSSCSDGLQLLFLFLNSCMSAIYFYSFFFPLKSITL